MKQLEQEQKQHVKDNDHTGNRGFNWYYGQRNNNSQLRGAWVPEILVQDASQALQSRA